MDLRRDACGHHLDWTRGIAGAGRIARGGIQWRRCLSHLRRRDDLRRRLQYAAGAETDAGHLRKDGRGYRRVLHVAYAPGAAGSAATWRLSSLSSLQVRTLLPDVPDQYPAPGAGVESRAAAPPARAASLRSPPRPSS